MGIYEIVLMIKYFNFNYFLDPVLYHFWNQKLVPISDGSGSKKSSFERTRVVNFGSGFQVLLPITVNSKIKAGLQYKPTQIFFSIIEADLK